MSDIQQRTPVAGTQPDGQRRQVALEQPSGTGGMAIFAAIMLVMLGVFQAIAGIVAIFDAGYYLVGQNGLIVKVDYTTWGWVHLAVGVLALAAAFGLTAGAMWARVVGIGIAVVSAIVNFAFIPAFPFWALAIITIDVVVVYAIAVHGGELKEG